MEELKYCTFIKNNKCTIACLTDAEIKEIINKEAFDEVCLHRKYIHARKHVLNFLREEKKKLVKEAYRFYYYKKADALNIEQFRNIIFEEFKNDEWEIKDEE